MSTKGNRLRGNREDTSAFTEVFSKYKEHPRVLEIRLIQIFDMFEKEFGYDGAMRWFDVICKSSNITIDLIHAIINKRFDIKRKSKIQFKRYRQEVIFSAMCYGTSKYKAAKYFLRQDPSNFFRTGSGYNPKEFITDEWLLELDKEVFLSGSDAFKNSILLFMETITHLTNISYSWEEMQ